jgi:hypothetical protein
MEQSGLRPRLRNRVKFRLHQPHYHHYRIKLKSRGELKFYSGPNPLEAEVSATLPALPSEVRVIAGGTKTGLIRRCSWMIGSSSDLQNKSL